MFKKARIVLPAIALAGFGVVAVPQIAQAGSNLCDANRVCIYDDANFVALLGQRQAGGFLANVSSGANDQMSSWENKTSTNGRWYVDANGGGTCRNLIAQREDPYVGSTANDRLTSWATNGAC